MNEDARSVSTLRTSDHDEHLNIGAIHHLEPEEILTSFQKTIQQEMEIEALSHGRERFKKATERNKEQKRETNNQSGLKALKDSMEPVSMAISGFLEDALSKPGKRHIAVQILKEVGPEEAALLTAKAVLDTLSNSTIATRMVVRIANVLLDELRFRKFREAAPGLFEWKMRNFDTSSYAHMKRSLDAAINFAEIDVSQYNLPETQKVLIGTKCLDLFIYATHKNHVIADGTICTQCSNHGYVQRENVAYAHRQTTFSVPTQDTLDWIKRIEKDLLFMAPTYRPTLIPPKPWTTAHNGGYWFKLKDHFPILRPHRLQVLNDLDAVEMPVVYEALNALQDTSWRINTRVMAVMNVYRERTERSPHDVIPSEYDEPLPPRPEIMHVDERTEAQLFRYIQEKRKNAEVLPELPEGWTAELADKYSNTVRKWRKAAGVVRNRNHIRRTKYFALRATIATAELLIESTGDTNGQFYFPHNLDFRGRAYAIPLYLQPQGDDLQKGLLSFGEGRRLGTPGAVEWLAVHGANCLADAPGGRKLDKLPFAERVRWIHDHSNEIRAVAEDPLSNDWWTAADSPFCFLAFCFEWAGYLRDKLDHVSYLPIAMDGSCNGLQHYSAMLRDEVGGKAVNLVPSDTPQDIYARVAEKVNDMLRTAVSSEPMAADWLRWGKVDRKFVKRQVMTLPYGSKKYGFKSQIREFIHGLAKEDQPEFLHSDDDRDGFKHMHFIAQIVWDALAGTVTAATSGMEWLQSLARIVAKEALPICWTAPNGLPVVQGYREETRKFVDTTLCGVRYQPRLQVATNTLDRNKQVSGIAPNIIHSLDASAMMLTVCAAKAEGIDHFAMIHDSYGVHAAVADQMSRITREQFVKMYQDNDVLDMIESGLMSTVDVSKVKKYPVRPALGTLDLEAVKQSKYFFS